MFAHVRIALALVVLAVLAPAGGSAAAQEPSADEIMKQAHLNMYYAADNMKVTVDMNLTDKRGKTRSRKFIMLRMDEGEGEGQKYYTYFLEPSDVRRTTFMVWKDPQKDDSRWIYIPAVDLVKRISASDKGSSFVGSDFSYEDVSGRHWTDDTHTLVGTEDREGRKCYKVESVPREDDSFSKKITWIGVDEMLPVREEYYDGDELERVFTADEIEEIEGHLTITARTMKNVKKDHSTTVVFSGTDYDGEMKDSLFTERFLKSPPTEILAN